MISELIDKQDNFEIIRDQIAGILVSEVASQMALATVDGQNPDDWKLRIFTERSNSWEQFLNDNTDRSPLVNVWIDNCNYDKKGSNAVERQKATGTYNIDCYGYAISADVIAGGHKPGDKEASLEAQRATRLVRNILMSAEYKFLGLRGVVWSRWLQRIEIFQPQQESKEIQKIVASRLALEVMFNEFSPEIPPEELGQLTIDIKRVEDGQILLEVDYLYIDPDNEAPVAVNDAITAIEDTLFTSTTSLIANDTDAEGDPLSAIAGTFPTTQGGSLVLASDGSYTYISAANFFGTDTVNYTVTDGYSSDVGTLTITVDPVNDAPVAVNDAITATEDTLFTSTVDLDFNDTDVDGDLLTVVAGTFPTTQGGSLVLASDGSYTYTPALNFFGTDTVDYTVTDGTLTDVGTLTITVDPVNDAPVAVNDAITATENTLFTSTVDLDFNDTDVDGDLLTVVAGTFPTTQGGSLVLASDGSYTYTPDTDFTGTDTVDYTVTDGILTDVGTLTITVEAGAGADTFLEIFTNNATMTPAIQISGVPPSYQWNYSDGDVSIDTTNGSHTFSPSSPPNSVNLSPAALKPYITRVLITNDNLTQEMPSPNGLINLTHWESDRNNMTGSIPSVSSLTNLIKFSIYDNLHTGDLPDISALTSLTTVFAALNDFTGWAGGTVSSTIVDYHAFGNALSEAAVNGLIIAFDNAGGTNGDLLLDQGTSAAPTGAGITARNSLIAKGWTVDVN